MGVRIERATNGYIIHARDPQIVKANAKPNSKWRSPEVDILCKTIEECLSWLKLNLDKAMPAEKSFDTAFAAAIVEDDDE